MHVSSILWQFCWGVDGCTCGLLALCQGVRKTKNLTQESVNCLKFELFISHIQD